MPADRRPSEKPYGQRNATRALGCAAEKAGIESSHDPGLLHGFVGWLILERRLDPVRVSRQVGHTSAAFTLSVYSHEFEAAGHADELRQADRGLGLRPSARRE